MFSEEYKPRSFIEVAKHHVNEKNETRCPCIECLNHNWQHIHVVQVHLLRYGMSIAYLKWTGHEETMEDQGEMAIEVDEQISEPNGYSFDIIGDLFPSVNAGDQHRIRDEDDLMVDVDDEMGDEDGTMGNEYDNNYDKLLLEAQRELYPG